METTEDNIIETILKLMENAEQFIDKSGVEKKAIVLSNLKTLLGVDTYEQYKYIIMGVIDFAVQVSKGRKINLNDIKKRFFFCCK